VIVVSDAGPLIALARIDTLSILFELSSEILIPPQVFEETILAGIRIGEKDALKISGFYEQGLLKVVEVRTPHITMPEGVDPGEREGILLALQECAQWLLVDDRRARSFAEQIFARQSATTRIRGALGVLIEAFRQGILSRSETLSRLSDLEAHPEIWLHESLIRQATKAVLQRSD
jgi:uncharacterized protein